MNRNQTADTLFGDSLLMSAPAFQVPNPRCCFTGVDASNQRRQIPFNEDLLGRHMMLLGGIGTGKTNAFCQLIRQLRASLRQDEVMIIFDTKGDFYQSFYQPGDVVISNDPTATGPERRDYWNIFNEIYGGEHMMENIIEISKTLFAEACERTNQVFFPNAARDLFMAAVTHFIRSRPVQERTNRNLIRYLNSTPTAEFRAMLESYDDFRAMASYIAKDDSSQTQGVMSELLQITRNIFVGNFAKDGTLGLRNLVYQKGGRVIFIEYDLSVGMMLSPIYSLLFDQAIKEALCRERSPGNVYFITDEFRLLPNLQHIDDAVNFGRSLGVKFMIGVQNVEQIYEIYGQERARSILSGFLTSVNFRVSDHSSKEFIKELFGKNRKIEAYVPLVQNRGMVEESREAYVVEDWNISRLQTGQAIIGLPGSQPFLFQFDRFQ
jgi:type IV secretory pathway TraG/TraD family ATPase VirD4